jgi:predicted small metal-binding protein
LSEDQETLYYAQCPRCPYQAVGTNAVELQADVLDHDLEAHGILPMDNHGLKNLE